MVHGVVALVGSGEYLPHMAEFENSLLHAGVNKGKSRRYVQLATAAGRESQDRRDYWRNLGKAQCDRLDVEQVFVPVFNRKDAENSEFAEMIADAGLIYLSGGDPSYLATTLRGTSVGDAIIDAWKSGSSLAGCSAGAMALANSVPHLRMRHSSDSAIGLGVIPHIQTIPHYDKFLGWIPDRVTSLMLAAEPGIHVVGIDEDTALYSEDLLNWKVVGEKRVHHLVGEGNRRTYENSESFVLTHEARS